ncbi:Bifunctional inhibitor/lipid-transfer protein/seed storage 2S albumin superfamily protein, partial [Prunus dulcis]
KTKWEKQSLSFGHRCGAAEGSPMPKSAISGNFGRATVKVSGTSEVCLPSAGKKRGCLGASVLLDGVSGTSEVCLPSAGKKAWLPWCSRFDAGSARFTMV